MNREEKIYYLALNFVEGAQPRALCSLCGRVRDAGELFGAPSLSGLALPEQSILKKIARHGKRYLDLAEKEMRGIERQPDISLAAFKEEGYPELLKKIYDPPLLLYVKGRLPEERCVSIVGSRDSTRQGNETALRLAGELCRGGLAVVSGMALGIDTYAHRGALDAGGRTVAVLGSGLGRVYPQENRGLFERIAQNGAVVSEFPLQGEPERFNFPRRNRIISGMSAGTVVVEAAERSGALITASFALEQGREVFAVPGPVANKMSRGTNRLIKEGARLVQDANDILEELGMAPVNVSPPAVKDASPGKGPELSAEETRILKMVDVKPVGMDELCSRTRIRIGDLERMLMMLEIKGYVEQVPGHRFRRSG